MSERLYDFNCTNCHITCEKWQKSDDFKHLECDKCGQMSLVRQFPSPNFKMPREMKHGFDGDGAKVKFAEAGRYNPKTGKIDT